MHTFTAEIQAGSQGGAYVIVPLDVESVFGKKRVKILATFDGEPYRGTMVRMGTSDHIVIVKKAIREKIGKTVGDTVQVPIEEDTAPRVVELPEDFQNTLTEDPAASKFYHSLSYTHQKEYVEWITSAKRPDTRERRIGKALEMLRTGKKQR